MKDGLQGGPGSTIKGYNLASTDDLTVGDDATITDALTVNGNTSLGNAAADTVTMTATMAGKIPLALNGGAASASGLLMGVGTSASPATTAAASNMFAEFRTQTTATSGDSRGLYWRHELKGAGVSGEAVRAFSKISAAVATARGAHISLDVNNSPAGSVTGLGVGVDAQILAGNIAVAAGGTYAVINAEVYSAGATTDWGAATEISYIRFNNGGNASGIADMDDDLYLLSLQGHTIGAGNMVQADTDETKFSHKIRIRIASTTYYLMATAT